MMRRCCNSGRKTILYLVSFLYHKKVLVEAEISWRCFGRMRRGDGGSSRFVCCTLVHVSSLS